MRNEHVDRAIKIMGGQSQLGAAIGLTQQQVSDLLNGKVRVSPPVALLIEIKTGVKAHELRPDKFKCPN